MNTEITIIASIFLLLGGLAAFPFTLDYSNTSWMPRWMRPDVDYLERPFRYDYPGRGMQIIFSLLVLFVGAMSLLTLLDKNLSQTVTPDSGSTVCHLCFLPVRYPVSCSCVRNTTIRLNMPTALPDSACGKLQRLYA